MYRKDIAETVKEALVAYCTECNIKTPVLRESTRLFWDNGLLDSLGVVSLAIHLELAFQDKGETVCLSDVEALGSQDMPFQTVGTLCDYIAKKINGRK